MTTPRITAELIEFYAREANRQRNEAFLAAFRAIWRALTRRREALAPQPTVAAAR
jgi:hypothetical protein